MKGKKAVDGTEVRLEDGSEIKVPFVMVPGVIITDRNLGNGAFRAWVLIKQLCAGKSYCFHRQELLASLLNVSSRTYRDYQRELSDKGYIELEKRGGKTSIIRLSSFKKIYGDEAVKDFFKGVVKKRNMELKEGGKEVAFDTTPTKMSPSTLKQPSQESATLQKTTPAENCHPTKTNVAENCRSLSHTPAENCHHKNNVLIGININNKDENGTLNTKVLRGEKTKEDVFPQGENKNQNSCPPKTAKGKTDFSVPLDEIKGENPTSFDGTDDKKSVKCNRLHKGGIVPKVFGSRNQVVDEKVKKRKKPVPKQERDRGAWLLYCYFKERVEGKFDNGVVRGRLLKVEGKWLKDMIKEYDGIENCKLIVELLVRDWDAIKDKWSWQVKSNVPTIKVLYDLRGDLATYALVGDGIVGEKGRHRYSQYEAWWQEREGEK